MNAGPPPDARLGPLARLLHTQHCRYADRMHRVISGQGPCYDAQRDAAAVLELVDRLTPAPEPGKRRWWPW